MKIIIFLCMLCSLLFSQGSIQTPLGIYNSTPPVLANNSFSPFQLDQNGSLKVTVANLTIPWGSLTGNIGDQTDLVNMFGLYLRCPDTACLWSNSTNYQIRDVAYDGNDLYLALLAGSNHQPSISPAYWKLVGGGGANVNGYYLVNQATNAPTNAVNLGVLTTGLMKLTVSGSVATPSTATAGTDYMPPGQVYNNRTTISNTDSPYTVASTDSYILCNAVGGTVIINLPLATNTGREISVKKTDASVNGCNPTRVGSDTIDGATSYSLTTQYASSKVVDAAIGVWHRSHVNQVGGDLSGISTNATVASIGGKAVSLANSFTTSGNYALTLTQTAATNVTLPTSGTLVAGGDALTTAGAIAYVSTSGVLTDTSTFYVSGWPNYPILHLRGAANSAISTGISSVDYWNMGTDASGNFFVVRNGANIQVLGSNNSSPYCVSIGANSSCSSSTLQVYNAIATGTTRVVFRAGAGDAAGDHLLSGYLNDGTTEKWYVTRDGVIKSGGYKSSDGTAGVTVTTCTGFKDGLCISGT